jgi:hypothetical protein
VSGTRSGDTAGWHRKYGTDAARKRLVRTPSEAEQRRRDEEKFREYGCPVCGSKNHPYEWHAHLISCPCPSCSHQDLRALGLRRGPKDLADYEMEGGI